MARLKPFDKKQLGTLGHKIGTTLYQQVSAEVLRRLLATWPNYKDSPHTLANMCSGSMVEIYIDRGNWF